MVCLVTSEARPTKEHEHPTRSSGAMVENTRETTLRSPWRSEIPKDYLGPNKFAWDRKV